MAPNQVVSQERSEIEYVRLRILRVSHSRATRRRTTLRLYKSGPSPVILRLQ